MWIDVEKRERAATAPSSSPSDASAIAMGTAANGNNSSGGNDSKRDPLTIGVEPRATPRRRALSPDKEGKVITYHHHTIETSVH